MDRKIKVGDLVTNIADGSGRVYKVTEIQKGISRSGDIKEWCDIISFEEGPGVIDKYPYHTWTCISTSDLELHISEIREKKLNELLDE